MAEEKKPKSFQKSLDGNVYHISCISFYSVDRERAKGLVMQLKKKGIKNVTASSLIRYLLEDMEKRINAGENINFPEKLR